MYGAAYDKDGKFTGYFPLRHSVSKRALRAPVGREIILTDSQIRAMGLRRWQTQRLK